MKIFYKEPENKKCNICGNTDNLEFVQIKYGTHHKGMYFKHIGYVCSKCHTEVIAPIFSKFQQVWDTQEFEGYEMNEHLLIEPENKRNDDGTLRW